MAECIAFTLQQWNQTVPVPSIYYVQRCVLTGRILIKLSIAETLLKSPHFSLGRDTTTAKRIEYLSLTVTTCPEFVRLLALTSIVSHRASVQYEAIVNEFSFLEQLLLKFRGISPSVSNLKEKLGALLSDHSADNIKLNVLLKNSFSQIQLELGCGSHKLHNTSKSINKAFSALVELWPESSRPIILPPVGRSTGSAGGYKATELFSKLFGSFDTKHGYSEYWFSFCRANQIGPKRIRRIERVTPTRYLSHERCATYMIAFGPLILRLHFFLLFFQFLSRNDQDPNKPKGK